MESMDISIHVLKKKEFTEDTMDMDRECLPNGKRSAECSPEGVNKKRSAFCDITNKDKKSGGVSSTNPKKPVKPVKVSSSVSSDVDEKNSTCPAVNCEPVAEVKEEPVDSTLYVTCNNQDDMEDSGVSSSYSKFSLCLGSVPSNVEDFDKCNLTDPFCESVYAPHIFEYYKSREKEFRMKKYLQRQPEVTKGMRAVLVDWMVEVQETFELNHETLYLAVKLVDFYLLKHTITKATLQLVGATAVLLASKYDERSPPLVDDFLYICDDSYSRSELVAMEGNILRTMDFQLGVPISYRFLRRYARVSRSSMETLTLARYILEMSLMDYELIEIPDSHMAAAALLLALRMKNLGSWTPTLEYYSGYKEEELLKVMKYLNKVISVLPNKNVMTIRTKYSHKIFFEVANVPPLKFEE